MPRPLQVSAFNTSPASYFSTNSSVTAGTNVQGQGLLVSDFNVITVTSNNPSGVTLPPAYNGRNIIIVNRGTNAVSIYPASAAQIDSLGSNIAIQIPVGGWIELNASSTTQWYSTQGIFTAPNFSTNSSVTAASASPIQGQAPLTSDYNVITSAAGNPSAVTLPIATTGRRIIISNRGANVVDIYPASGATIDALGANNSLRLNVGGWIQFNASSATQWYSTQGIFAAPNFSTNAGVTAGTNAQNQATLTADINLITSAANAPSGVTLPQSNAGRRIIIFNRGANPVNVYPATSVQIDSLGINTPIQMAVNSWMEFNSTSSSQWYSTQGIFAAPNFSTNAGVTAGTNAQGQGPLTSDFNVITSAANAPSGVTLPTATAGRRVIISNRGANPVNIYPASGAQIDGLAANVFIQVPSLGIIELNASSATQWYSSNTLMYGGTTKIAGQFDTGTAAPTNTNRLNYDGNLYATNFIGSGTITSLKENRVALGSGAIDLSLGNYFSRTITAFTSFSVSNVPAAGTSICIILDLTNAGAFGVSWWTGVKWPLGSAPTLTVSGRDVLGFFTHDGGTTWSGFLLGRDIK